MKAGRPKPFCVGDARVRAVRGPRDDRGWYYRAQLYESGGERTIWTGWALRPLDAQRKVLAVFDNVALAPAKTEVRTIRDLLDVWAAAQVRRSDLAPISAASYATSARHLVRHHGGLVLSRLTTATLADIRDTMIRAGSAASSVRIYVGTLVAAWTWGLDRGLTPNRRLRRPRVRGPRVNNHSTPSVDAFWSVVDRLRGERRAQVSALGMTGCRIGELGWLRWADCDEEGDTITVDGKTGTRTIPVPSSLWAALAALPRDRDRVFSRSIRTLNRPLANACAACGVPVFTPHGIRRLVVNQLYGAGVDVSVAASLLGHSAAVALKHYRTVRPDAKARAVDQARLGRPRDDSDEGGGHEQA